MNNIVKHLRKFLSFYSIYRDVINTKKNDKYWYLIFICEPKNIFYKIRFFYNSIQAEKQA